MPRVPFKRCAFCNLNSWKVWEGWRNCTSLLHIMTRLYNSKTIYCWERQLCTGRGDLESFGSPHHQRFNTVSDNLLGGVQRKLMMLQTTACSGWHPQNPSHLHFCPFFSCIFKTILCFWGKLPDVILGTCVVDTIMQR